jgi:hypothetical protein
MKKNKLTLEILDKAFNKAIKGIIEVVPNMWVPPNMIYKIDNENFYMKYPLKKDGTPDMRFSINRREGIFND